MKMLLTLVATSAALALAGQAAATEYVLNGGFEDPTDALANWSPVGNYNTGNNKISTDGRNGTQNEMHIGNNAGDGVAGISQVLGTAAAGTYDVSLWFRESGSNTGGGQTLQVLWNGTLVGRVDDVPFSSDYAELTYHVVGAGSDTLTIQGFASAGYNFVDDISVVEGLPVSTGPTGTGGPGSNGPGGVPEPASWALMILGFGATGAALRRRRQTAVAA